MAPKHNERKKPVSFYLGFCLEDTAQGVRAITHEELECGGKKVRDSEAEEMYCLNNFHCFFGGGYRDLFFLSSHNLSSDLETIIAASTSERDQIVEIMTI